MHCFVSRLNDQKEFHEECNTDMATLMTPTHLPLNKLGLVLFSLRSIYSQCKWQKWKPVYWLGQSLCLPVTLCRNVSLCLQSLLLNAENIQNFGGCPPVTTEPKSKTSFEISCPQLSPRGINTGTLFLLCCGSPSPRAPTCPTCQFLQQIVTLVKALPEQLLKR